jgi:hypothetical protein
MAEKNWLIRTKKSQLLGPVTKQKILEFVQKGALCDEDEITSGNGYWFSVREKDLLSKYVEGDLLQSFNPISEAPDILTVKEGTLSTSSFKPDTMPVEAEEAVEAKSSPADEELDEDEAENVDNQEVAAMPSSEDLDYPDMGDAAEATSLPSNDDLEYPEMVEPASEDLEYPDTPTTNSNVEQVQAEQVQAAAPSSEVSEEISQVSDADSVLPSDDDLEYPTIPGDSSLSLEPQEDLLTADSEPILEMEDSGGMELAEPIQETEEPISIAPKKNKPATVAKSVKDKQSTKKKTKRTRRKAKRNDAAYLIVLFILVAAAIGGVYYYYTKILNKELVILNRLNPIQSVMAQDVSPEILKKKI